MGTITSQSTLHTSNSLVLSIHTPHFTHQTLWYYQFTLHTSHSTLNMHTPAEDKGKHCASESDGEANQNLRKTVLTKQHAACSQ